MLTVAALALTLTSVGGVQDDADYSAKIRQYTTESFFLTPLVDHLPVATGIPTPDVAFGHIIGAPNVLDYASDIHKYFRMLEKASPRIRIVSMGKSEEGREMIVALISDEANLKRLDQIREANATLGDPRKIANQAQADDLIQKTVPMYWATGGMHAPESGPPEMLAELAYRMVASEEPYIQDIRKNEIVMITPVLDVDGRERVVDLYRYRKANPTKPPIPLLWWGHYVAHDDNRDALTYRLALSSQTMKTWLEYHPTVLHDLHESVPYLYISTGTGPYNPWLDPLVISEWQDMAYNEIQQMTALGVPGVWTHNYYDGWAASYGFFIAQGHNGIGRFYETFSGGGADTGIRSVGSEAQRDWYRPNPPFPRVRWSIRDNVNLSESALLMGMHKVAMEKDKFLQNYYLKSKRSVDKAKIEGPVAYVLAKRDGFRQRDLLGVLDRQGVEVKQLTFDEKTKDGTFAKGSYVIRMDQPYSRMADMMFDEGYYKPTDPVTYDDTGWQLGPLYNLPVTRVTDPILLNAAMGPIRHAATTIVRTKAYAITPSSDPEFSQLAFGQDGKILEKSTKAKKPDGSTVTLPAGTLISNKPGAIASIPLSGVPSAPSHSSRPRIAVVHTWQSTQDEGWARIALDSMGLPYKYVSVHELRDKAVLKSLYDVIIFPEPGGGTGQSLVSGLPMLGDAIPWKATKDYPNIGVLDSTDDIRGGIELEGIVHIKDFVKSGGLFICVGNACRVPIDFGLTPGVEVSQTTQLNAPGGVFRVERADDGSPVLGGYGEELGVYFNAFSLPVLSVSGGGGGRGGRRGGGRGAGGGTRASGRGSQTDADIIQGRPPYTPKALPGDVPERGTYQRPMPPHPRILLQYGSVDNLIMSGLLDHGDELAGKAALVDAPLGLGHILLFSFNPFYRGETVGSYELVLNAALNHANLGSAPVPVVRSEE